jgi:ABC-type transporter Mla subunit MlaD
MRHLLERLLEMALDVSPLANNVEALTASIQSLVDLASAKIAEADAASAATAQAVAADEASAVAALGQLSDHLAALKASVDGFVSAHQPAPAAPVEPAAPAA